MKKSKVMRSLVRIVAALVLVTLVLGSIVSSTSAQAPTDDAKLTGRFGGSLADIRLRFGEPSWIDTGLIGYNSVSLQDVPSIVVVYYDDQESVNKISLVYREKPAQFTDSAAIQQVVKQVMPQDVSCGSSALTTSTFGSEVYGCKSAALSAVHPDWALSDTPGSLSYAVDPTADDYYEIVVQPGTGVSTAASNSTGTDSAPTPVQGTTSESNVSLSADETAYATQVYLQTQLMVTSLDRFANLMQSPAAFTDLWVLDVATELALWRQVYQEALAMTPPPRFASIHAKYVEGLGYYNQATYEIASGIDNLDPDAIDRAVVLMDLGNAAILEASAEIRAMTP